MPTLVTGISTERRRRSPQCGFSLLELLVVCAIIALFVGAVVLSWDVAIGTDREVERQVTRLKGIVDLAREEALMQTRDFGIFFSHSGYRFYTYDYGRQEWQAPLDDGLLTEHTLDGQLALELLVEDRDVVLADEFEPERIDDPAPQVLVLSSGEITPFEARISREFVPGEHILTASADGKTEITTRGYAP